MFFNWCFFSPCFSYFSQMICPKTHETAGEQSRLQDWIVWESHFALGMALRKPLLGTPWDARKTADFFQTAETEFQMVCYAGHQTWLENLPLIKTSSLWVSQLAMFPYVSLPRGSIKVYIYWTIFILYLNFWLLSRKWSTLPLGMVRKGLAMANHIHFW